MNRLAGIYRELKSSLTTEDSFVRNAAYMVTGSGAGILIQLLTVPVIARIYDNPEVYGLFGLFSVYTNTLGGMAMLSYNMAFVLPEDETVFNRLLRLTVVTSALWCLVITLVVAVGGAQLAAPLQLDGIGPWLYAIGPVAFLVAIDRILADWSVRQRRFRASTIYGTANMAVNKGFNIAYGKFVSNHTDGLMWTHVLNYLLNPLLSGLFVIRNFRSAVFARVSWADLVDTAKAYRHYPGFFFWGSSVQVLSAGLPAVMLPVLGFGLESVAMFSWAIVVLEMPLRMMGSGVSSVFLNKSAEIVQQRPDELALHTRRLFRVMLMLTAACMSLIYLFGEPLFSLMLGPAWRQAGELASVLSIYYFFRLLSVPLSVLYGVLRKEREFFLYHMLIFVVRVTSLMLAALTTRDLVTLMMIFSLANAAVYALFTVRVLNLAGIPARPAVLQLLAWSLGVFILCAAVKGVMLNAYC